MMVEVVDDEIKVVVVAGIEMGQESVDVDGMGVEIEEVGIALEQEQQLVVEKVNAYDTCIEHEDV